LHFSLGFAEWGFPGPFYPPDFLRR
jgi:hypothetical protein